MARMIKGNPREIDGLKVPIDDTELIEELTKGKTVYHWEGGNSLYPIIKDREYCKITPIKNCHEVRVGDVVYCIIRALDGSRIPMVHMVTKISDASYSGEKWFEIGDTRGYVFGWSNEVLGKAVGTNMFNVG